MATKLYDVLIIGGGPAGLSMATALARQLYTALVLDSGVYRNAPTKHMHNVIGFDHADPAAFRAKAREDLEKRYSSIEFKSATVETVKKLDSGIFEAVDSKGTVYQGKRLGLGTGGRGIFHCLYCHGFEERGAESVGVFAGGIFTVPEMVSHVAPMAKRLAKSVTVYSNGKESLLEGVRAKLHSSKINYDNRIIKSFQLVDNGPAVKITFEDGSSKVEGFVASHPNVVQTSPFAEQLGLEMQPSGEIKVEPPFYETSVKGCFAAGDAATVLKSVLQAMAMGAFSGTGAATQLQYELDAKDEL
ncbi:hypothetical protein LRP88_12419 [Fusarium phalaenopsidis]